MSALREVGLATPQSEARLGSGEAVGAVSENDDCGPVDGPQVLNHVVLARKKGELWVVSELQRGRSPLFTNTQRQNPPRM